MIRQAIFCASLIALTLGVFGCQKAGTTSATSAKPAVPSGTTVPASATPPAATPAPADDAPRITLVDAKKAFDADEAIFVDTRAEGAYKDEHIKGAINIMAGTVDANVSKLSKSKKIIAYCS